MHPFFRATLLCLMTSSVALPVLADEKEAKSTIDKAIKAMGGEEKLAEASEHSRSRAKVKSPWKETITISPSR